MDSQNNFISPKLIVLFLFTTLTSQTLSIDPKYMSCAPRTCGQGPNISYPFWFSDDQHSFCGHPNFEITCSRNNPVLTISNDDYVIKDISYDNHSLLVANAAAAAAVYQETCPTPAHNFSLDRSPFNISPGYTNFSLLYNCSQKPDEIYSAYPISCATNDTQYSFAAFHIEALEYYNYSFGSCQSIVKAPLHAGDGDFESLLSMNYTEVLRLGFVLNWTANNCSTCERSGGRCGFENNEFICFCRDRPRLKSCPNGEKVNVKRKVAIVVATCIGTVAIMVIVFYFWLRRNKNKYAPSSFVSRSIASNPPSKTDVEKGENSYHGVHLFTYAELEEATNNFDESRELGDGGFGTVYYGKLRDGRVVAVKRLYENNYKRVEQFKNEIEILARLRHEHLVSLHGCTSRHSRELLLVYDYIPNGTVADHLHGERTKPGALPWGIRMKIAIETATALAYLHASEIIHRDVKTNNILLDNNFCVKVADFGLSRLFPTDVTHVSTAPQGTPGYVDPEYHECYQLTSKSDVYSFGVVLVELISSMPAVDITRHRHEINLSNMAITKIQSDALHELVDSSLGFETDYMVRRMISGVAELAFQCLQCAKDMRPTMDRVLEVLKEIQNHNYSTPKAEEMDIPSDDVGLLKSGSLSLSPDSVTAKWNISSSTTPNASG